jgi:hypothetical protein
VALALIVVAGLAGAGTSQGVLLRQWDYSPSSVVGVDPIPGIAPENVRHQLFEIGAGFSAALAHGDREAQLREVVAMEWEIVVGALHPFYDGCGRIARYFTALTTLWLGDLPPVHESREAYFAAANGGVSTFQTYWHALPKARLPSADNQ